MRRLEAAKTRVSAESLPEFLPQVADIERQRDGPQAEFVGGVEGSFGAGLSMFGSGEFDISSDGKSKSYVGQAGFRQEF